MLIAVSGGSDSVALTLLLRDLAKNGEFTLAGIAHLNHQLRPTADRDQEFCRVLAGCMAVPFVEESVDVGGYAQAQRLSVEDAARRIRYAFLERTADRLEASRIAVGHTQDDQAETLLLKLMRGAGLIGIAGIFPQRGRIIRPLMDVSREHLRRYLVDQGETWVDDESNDDLAIPRNRIRHRVLPELDRAYGGSTRPAIARAAALVRDDARWLDDLASARGCELLTTTPSGLELDAATLALEPLPLRRRIVLAALRDVAGAREVGMDNVESVLQVLDGTCGGTDVPGGRVELRRGKLVLFHQGPSPR